MAADQNGILFAEDIIRYEARFNDLGKDVIGKQPFGQTAEKVGRIFGDLLSMLSAENIWAVVQVRSNVMDETTDGALRQIESLAAASSGSEAVDRILEVESSAESLIFFIEEQIMKTTRSGTFPPESLRLIRKFSAFRVRFALIVSEISTSNELNRLSERVDTQVGQAMDAAKRAETAAENAARSAGERGATDLQAAFNKYATDEDRTSKRFRNATMVVLGFVVLAASALVAAEYLIPADGNGVFSWRQTLYHLAFLSALSALAAYLARQATHHRQSAVWAEGISVQLKSFLAFVDPMNDQPARSRVYEAFAKRVLGSPPDLGKTGDETGANQLLTSLAELIAKRAS
ncbi:hypothetical protein [Rathayibacter sp. VKM Ac-2927]|uniref:hypothetical protein n=1 Tax=Rathayibacter sp. VKM Ac-2927 TaxID=2929478 RepID=UPI001FB453D0|nr:hypothetical protein [Rathayibacter sp. VKM Ac-2927]MCJ1687800.1 hypothetical protein [Rathayibacter sp. VKM Ac-2927]